MKFLDDIKYIRGDQLGLKYGTLGLAFAIDQISHYANFQIPKKYLELKNYAVSKYLDTFQPSPIKYIPDDDLFSECLYILQSYRIGVDSELEHCYLLERMIAEVDECEHFLNLDIKGIYSVSSASVQFLTSLAHYLSKVQEWKIYPYKARLLKNVILERIKECAPISQLETVLKNVFLPHMPDVDVYDSNLNCLSEAGYLSALYGEPTIFKETLSYYKDIELEECTTSQLLGIGLGLEMLLLGDVQPTDLSMQP